MSLPDGTIENPQISQPESLFHAPTALSLAARAAGHGTGTPSGPMNITDGFPMDRDDISCFLMGNSG